MNRQRVELPATLVSTCGFIVRIMQSSLGQPVECLRAPKLPPFVYAYSKPKAKIRCSAEVAKVAQIETNCMNTVTVPRISPTCWECVSKFVLSQCN